MKTAAAVLLLAAGASATQVSPVQKVVQLLGELKVKVQKDLKAEEGAMDEYTKYCDDESKEREFAIETAASEIEDYSAVIESSTAKISEFEATVAESGSEVASKQEELAGASKERSASKKDFEAAETELVDTVDMLGRAASVLERELSFVQGKVNKKAVLNKLGGMVMSLQAIMDASWVSTAAKADLTSFLNVEDNSNDLSLLQQPQASSKAYESKSGGIVARLHDMQDKAEDQLAELRKAEMKSKFDFQMLEQSLTDSIKNLEEQIGEASNAKSTTEQEKAKAEEDLAKTTEGKKADAAFLSNLQMECQTKAQEWEQRQTSATEEMAAIDKASEILSSGVKESFVQVATKTRRVSVAAKMNEDDSDKRTALVHALRKMSRKFNSFALMQMAGRAGSDPFVKIRGLVEEMITKLEKQAEEEATQEAFCQAETKKTRVAQAKKEESVEKHQTRIDKATAGISTLETEVAELNKELAEIVKSNKDATAIRTEEKALFDKSSKDYKDSAEAITKAMEVLREFYGGAAFLQQPSFGGKKSDSGNSIISFLEVAQSDFTRLLAEAEADEAQAVKAYEKLTQDNAVAKATKAASVKGKTSEIQQLKVAVEDSTSDLNTSSKELDAVMEYLDKLKPQCESKAMTYEERKAKRDAEIAGLKNALEILSGDEPALSLVQSKAFLARVHKH